MASSSKIWQSVAAFAMAIALNASSFAADPPAAPKVAPPADVPSVHHPTSDNHLKTAHARFMQRIKDDDKIQLLFLGDSITANWANAPDVWKEYFGQFDPANFGDGGDYTEHLLWRIENGELDGIHPKVVVLLIGINNLYHNPGNTPEQVVAGINKILDDIHQKLPESKVLLLGLFPYRDKNNPVRAACAAVNAIIRKLDDGQKTRYLELWDKFLEPDGSISKEVMKDGLHPTPYGYTIFAEGINPLLDEMMGVPLTQHTPATRPVAAAAAPVIAPVMQLPSGPVTSQNILSTDFANAEVKSYDKNQAISTGEATSQLIARQDYDGCKTTIVAADDKHALEFAADATSTTAHATQGVVSIIPEDIAHKPSLVVKSSVVLSILPLPEGATRGTLGIILFSSPQRLTTGPACISTIMLPQSVINKDKLLTDKRYEIDFTVDFSNKNQHAWEYTISEEGTKDSIFSSGTLATRDPTGLPAMFAITSAGTPFIRICDIKLSSEVPAQ